MHLLVQINNKNALYVHKKMTASYFLLLAARQFLCSYCACKQGSSSHPQPLSTTTLTFVPASFV